MMINDTPQPSPQQISLLTSLFAQNELEELIEQGMLLIRQFPQAVQVYNILCVAYSGLGKYEQAITCAEQAIEFKPDYVKAYINQANALMNVGRHEEAEASYNHAIQIEPGFAEAHNHLGAFFMQLNNYKEAASNFSRAVEIKPDYIKALNNLGCALNELGRNDEAIDCFNKAIALHADYAEAYNNLACTLLDIGRKDEAISSFNEAIEIKPDYAEAHRQLSALKRYESDDPQFLQMVELLESPELTDQQRMHLCFALAKAEEDFGDIDQSFSDFLEGNQLRKQSADYNIELDRDLFHSIKSTFNTNDPTSYHHIAPSDETEIQPIFILGMPRSGTTLVEQIISSHSQVYGAGEVEALDHALNQIQWDEATVSDGQLETLSSHYLSELKSLASNERFITDKVTINFRWIGFILEAMPNAKIIHMQRDARATCWSIFKHYFGGDGLGFAYDLNDLTEYYKIYAELMQFWENRYPGRIYHLQYEALTESQESETRKLLEYCGLEWEEQCLEFHQSKRAVTTASYDQVRKKMYQGSSNAWKKFEQHLTPMVKQLDGY